jgi:transposase
MAAYVLPDRLGAAPLASLVRKKVRGHLYWYAVESKRVNGKPRIVWQKYLGKSEDVIARLQGRQPQGEVAVYEFGAIVALLRIAERLGLEGIIDRCVPKRHQGVGIGRYLLLAAINRVVAAKSKAQIGAWYEQTVLRWLWGLPAHHFTSQRFWQAMDRVDEAAIGAIEDALAQAVTTTFGVRVEGLIYDATNFFSYIGTDNPAALPQRGHNKAKRNDLKQVSLALLASTDFHVPLLHEVYPGNVPDSKEFSAVCTRLADRCRALADVAPEITLVYDKGNNSAANLAAVERAPFHFVGSLVPGQHPDLLDVPRSAYREVNAARWPDLLAYRTTKKVFGVERLVVVTFNPALWKGQMKGLRAQQAKLAAALSQLQAKLRRWGEQPTPRGRRPTAESVGRTVTRLLRGRQVGPLLHWQASEEQGVIQLRYEWDQAALDRLAERHLGKTVLFTDHLDWTDEAVIAAYRSQAHIEDAFKQMKDPHFVSWWPMFHWTDQKIRVHAAYCVLALLLGSLLHRHVRGAGIAIGFDALIETLAGIRGVLDLPAGGQRRRSSLQVRLTRRTPLQQQLFNLLGLAAYHRQEVTPQVLQP